MKKISVLLAFVILLTCLCSCGSRKAAINKNLDCSKEVTLTVCGPWSSCKAIETVSQMFYEKYPNCNIVYEYIQNYQDMILNRLKNNSESVDLFLTENIQSDSPFYPYAEELFSHSELDLSDTNPALIKNFSYITTDEAEKTKIFSIPLGGDLRGLYVNKTLLSSVGAEVPGNVTELLSACQKLKNAGYIPMNGNPGMFGQRLLFPYIAGLIVHSENYQETYDRVNNCEEGISELFRKPMELLYTLNENYYYNYKYVETELNMFTDNSDEGCARYFFNVLQDGDGFTKKDDTGTVAFFAGTLAQQVTMDKIKEDYHSKIDYEFIMAPVSDEGGYAYVSPSKGIAINKNSPHLDWSVEFLNFLFTKEVNIQFSSEIDYIPNTKDSFHVIKEKFDIPEDRISDLGQMTFDYAFYKIIDSTLVTTSKINNPKYMNTDENGNSVMYSLEYYMEKLEAAFKEQRENGAQKQ